MRVRVSPTTVTRYAVYRPCGGPGTMILAEPAQGRNTYATREEASAMARTMAENNGTDRVRSVFGCDPGELIALPVECWPGHFDPVGIYFDRALLESKS